MMHEHIFVQYSGKQCGLHLPHGPWTCTYEMEGFSSLQFESCEDTCYQMSQKLPNPTVKSNNPTDRVELLELECCMLSTLGWVNFSTDTYYSDDEFVLHNSEWLVYSTWNCNTHVILLMNANGRKNQSPFNNFNTIWTHYMACHNGYISSLHHRFELTEL